VDFQKYLTRYSMARKRKLLEEWPCQRY